MLARRSLWTMLAAVGALVGVLLLTDYAWLPIIRGPRPRMVVKRPLPPEPPEWSLTTMNGNVACEPGLKACTVSGAGSLSRRFIPWSRLTGGRFEFDGGRAITLMVRGSDLRIESDVPLTLAGNVLSAQGTITGVRLNWRYWFDTNMSSDSLTDSEYAFQ